jgi:hypothetical protein
VDVGKFLADHWGDLASIVGLALTLWVAWRAKTAAEQARDAAQQVKARISNLDMLEEISAAVGTLNEIKQLLRIPAWDFVLDRCTVVRRHLVRVEQMKQGLSESQLGDIAKTIRQLSIIETKVDRAKAKAAVTPIDLTKLNRIVAHQADTLARLKIAIKQAGI